MLFRLSPAELQNIGFAVLDALINQCLPFLTIQQVGSSKSVPYPEPMYMVPDPSKPPSDDNRPLMYNDFRNDRNDFNGVLLAIAKHACRCINASPQMAALAQNCYEWPFLVSPHKSSLANVSVQLRKLGVQPRAHIGKFSVTLLTLKRQAITRHLNQINAYLKDPKYFLKNTDYAFDVDKIWQMMVSDETSVRGSTKSGIKPWWENWTKLANELLKENTKDPELWWKVIWAKILDEYGGKPEVAPTHPLLVEEFEDLTPILRSHLLQFRLNTWKRSSVGKRLIARKNAGYQSAVDQYNAEIGKIMNEDYAPDNYSASLRQRLEASLKKVFVTMARTIGLNTVLL